MVCQYGYSVFEVLATLYNNYRDWCNEVMRFMESFEMLTK